MKKASRDTARKPPTNAATGAVATGASAVGAASLGAIAVGALAVGALAVGALAVGRLSVHRARLRRVEIDDLAVGRLSVGALLGAAVIAVARIRTTPGEGDAFARFLQEQPNGERDTPLPQVHRSRTDPDLFLFQETFATEEALERHPPQKRLAALLSQAAEEGLVALSGAARIEIEVYRALL